MLQISVMSVQILLLDLIKPQCFWPPLPVGTPRTVCSVREGLAGSNYPATLQTRTHVQKLCVTIGGKEDADLQIMEVICIGAKCLLIPSILVLIIYDPLYSTFYGAIYKRSLTTSTSVLYF